MLCLGRRPDESVTIGDNIIVTVVHIGRGHVRLGFTAPKDISISRTELVDLFPAHQPVDDRPRIVPLTTEHAYPCHQHGCQDCAKCTADELIAGAGL